MPKVRYYLDWPIKKTPRMFAEHRHFEAYNASCDIILQSLCVTHSETQRTVTAVTAPLNDINCQILCGLLVLFIIIIFCGTFGTQGCSRLTGLIDCSQ